MIKRSSLLNELACFARGERDQRVRGPKQGNGVFLLPFRFPFTRTLDLIKKLLSPAQLGTSFCFALNEKNNSDYLNWVVFEGCLMDIDSCKAQALWHMVVIPSICRLTQEDFTLEASLGYKDTVFQTNTKIQFQTLSSQQAFMRSVLDYSVFKVFNFAHTRY